MNHLLEFCTTDRQRELVNAVIEHGGIRKAARALGTTKSNIDEVIAKMRNRAAKKGVAPENDIYYPLPETLKISGVSTLQRSPNGNLQWIKTTADDLYKEEALKAAYNALAADLPQLQPQKYLVKNYSNDLMAVYPLGDPHIGLRAWAKECGHDWDLVIAERKFVGVFDRLVKTAPHCKRAVIANLGDYFHADNMDGITERSGHRLDLDGRYAKMVDVGVTIIKRMIASALEHHETVEVINSVGNHDDTGALWLSVALKHMYEHEPRVVINTNPTPFHYVRHGKCLLGFHHGHSCKADRLPLVMATDRSAEWGETEFRYWLTGHIHHDSVKEYPGVKVESFRTLAAKDAYATWNGYRSLQDSKCIVFDKDEGEVERHTVNVTRIS